jgi:hypothetical protein
MGKDKIVEPESNTQSDRIHPPVLPQKQSPYGPVSGHPWHRSPIGQARFQTNNFSKNDGHPEKNGDLTIIFICDKIVKIIFTT